MNDTPFLVHPSGKRGGTRSVLDIPIMFYYIIIGKCDMRRYGAVYGTVALCSDLW